MAITLTKEALMVHEDMVYAVHIYMYIYIYIYIYIHLIQKFSDVPCSLCTVLTIEYVYVKSSF